jgi:hypothetical protein
VVDRVVLGRFFLQMLWFPVLYSWCNNNNNNSWVRKLLVFMKFKNSSPPLQRPTVGHYHEPVRANLHFHTKSKRNACCFSRKLKLKWDDIKTRVNGEWPAIVLLHVRFP